MKLSKNQKRTLGRISVSAFLLIMLSLLRLCRVLPDAWYVLLPLHLIAYLPVAWHVILKAFRGLFGGQLLDENLLMLLATVGAFVIGEYPEAVFVMLFYQIGELFESIAVGKSRSSIAALMNIRPDEARVERNGEQLVLSPDEVEIGEILIVRPGERIALDGIVVDGESELDTSSLTGESLPRAITAGDEATSGCINLSGLLRIRVTKPFGESTVSKILELVESSSLVKSKAENAVTRFAHWYTPSVVIGAILLAILPSILFGDWQRWLHTALIFLVVSCPCALVISVPLSYFGGLGCASRHGILVKGSNRLEMLARVDTVVFDKTGTLTEGRFTVTDVQATSGDENELLALAASAEQGSNHPIAVSIQAAFEERVPSTPLPHAERITELPGYGVRAEIGQDLVLVGNKRLMETEGIPFHPVDTVGSVVYVSKNGVFAGAITICDRVKAHAKDAIDALRACGVQKTVMLTGDRTAAAQAIAKPLGIDQTRSELLPADKVSHLEQLLEGTHGSLVFVGDGVNDAPAMARADVGIAMGALGSDAAIEAADVVLMDDDLKKMAKAIDVARFTHKIVLQNISFAIGIKLLFLLLSIFDMTNMWAATFADVGVAVIAILNAMRTLKR